MEINEVIRKLRETRNLTQENMADSIGVHITTMNRYESAGATIPNEKLEQIAKVFNVSVSDLYEYKQNPAMLEEPIEFYRNAHKKIVNVMVQLDGSSVMLNDWITTLKKLNAAIQ
jgi:transcriptional regulator with XRE-family HTH domain